MFNLTYLSNEQKKVLEKLQNHLPHALTPLDRNETQLMIQDIMNKAKPYQECTLEQAEELKTQLLTKMNILMGIGKLASVEVFQMHLTDVEFHITTERMKEKMMEAKKMRQPEEAPNAADKTPTINSIKRDRKAKQAYGQPRWLLGFEDEPDGTNK